MAPRAPKVSAFQTQTHPGRLGRLARGGDGGKHSYRFQLPPVSLIPPHRHVPKRILISEPPIKMGGNNVAGSRSRFIFALTSRAGARHLTSMSLLVSGMPHLAGGLLYSHHWWWSSGAPWRKPSYAAAKCRTPHRPPSHFPCSASDTRSFCHKDSRSPNSTPTQRRGLLGSFGKYIRYTAFIHQSLSLIPRFRSVPKVRYHSALE